MRILRVCDSVVKDTACAKLILSAKLRHPCESFWGLLHFLAEIGVDERTESPRNIKNGGADFQPAVLSVSCARPA
jgi:hypothetical protein